MSPKFSQKVEQQLGELTTSTGRTIHFLDQVHGFGLDPEGLWIKSKVPGFSELKTLDSVFSPEKSPQQAFLSKTEN